MMGIGPFFTLEVDTSSLNDKIGGLVDALVKSGADPGDIMAQETNRLMKQILKMAPPKTQRQGEKAVLRDLVRAARPVTYHNFKNERLREVLQKNDINAANAILARMDNKLRDWRFVYFTPDVHERARKSRGRVFKSQRQYVNNAHEGPYEGHRIKKQGFVGLQASGWRPAAISVGLKCQKYVERHAGRMPGYVINNLKAEGKPSITISNRANGIRESLHVVRSALTARQRAMSRRIKLIASGYNKDIARGMRPRKQAKRQMAA